MAGGSCGESDESAASWNWSGKLESAAAAVEIGCGNLDWLRIGGGDWTRLRHQLELIGGGIGFK
jgi:hypothetical protein